MAKDISIGFMEPAKEYFDALEQPVRQKFREAFGKTQVGHKGRWFEKLENTDGIFEFRVSIKNNAYRLFAFWDSTGEKETLIICTHGLNKKTQKTPKKDIEKAEKLKKQYFSGS